MNADKALPVSIAALPILATTALAVLADHVKADYDRGADFKAWAATRIGPFSRVSQRGWSPATIRREEI